MSDHRLDAMHTEIEVIFNGSVDHVHADTLHRFIDEQHVEIERLRNDLKDTEADADRYADKFHEHRAEIELLKAERDHWKEECSESLDEIERLRADMQTANDAWDELAIRNAKLQAVVDAAQKEIDNHDAGRGMTVKYLRQTIATLDTVALHNASGKIGGVWLKNHCPDCGKPIDMDNYLSLADHQECKIPIPTTTNRSRNE